MRLLALILAGLVAHAEGKCAPALLEELRALRDSLKPLAQADTAYDRTTFEAARAAGGYPLTEHCGCAATVVWSVHGGHVYLGRYRWADGRESLHVFNRLGREGRSCDVDLTKGQFGLPENADDLRPPPLEDISEIPARELDTNPRLQLFLRRYRAAQLQSSSSPR